MRPTAPEDIYARLVPDPETGCLLWTGCTGHGYGLVKIRQRHLLVHRVAWELARGPIPEGLELDHLCRVPSCANVDHLEPVTRRENTLRGIGPAAINARKTHCIHGHEFTPENTYLKHTSRGGVQRQCRACKRAQAQLASLATRIWEV